MANPGMSDELLAVMRQQELVHRDERRSRLLGELESIKKRFQNEGMLVEEYMDAEALNAHAKAVAQIKQQDEEFEKMRHRSYWRRLWLALINK